MPLVSSVVGRRFGAGRHELVQSREQEGLSAGEDEFEYAGLDSFGGELLDPIQAQGASVGPRRRHHAAVVTAEIAVEVGVEPQPGSWDLVGRHQGHWVGPQTAPNGHALAYRFRRTRCQYAHTTP